MANEVHREPDRQAEALPPAEMAQGERENDTEARRRFDEVVRDRELQGELDRRMHKAVETARGNLRREMEAQVLEAREAGGREALLTAQERESLARQQLEERSEALALREAELTRKELSTTARARLLDRGLPAALADLLDYRDEAACEASMEKVEHTFTDSLREAMRQRTAGQTPRAGDAALLRRAEAMEMSATERMRMKREDPAGYQRIFG